MASGSAFIANRKTLWTDIEPNEWSEENVAAFVEHELKLPQNVVKKFLDNNVDGNMLLELTNNELKHELGIESLGHRKKLLEATNRLKRGYDKENRAKFSDIVETSRRGDGLHCKLKHEGENLRHESHPFSTSGPISGRSSTEQPKGITSVGKGCRSDFFSDSDMDETTTFSSISDPPTMSLTCELSDADHEVAVLAAASEISKSTRNSHEIVKDTELSPTKPSCAPSNWTKTDDLTMSDELDATLAASLTEDKKALLVKQQVRSYQKELIDKIHKAEAKGHNAIVCAPTGSGKTLVAASYCVDVLMEARETSTVDAPNTCIYFLVPTNHLVDQQAKYISEYVENCSVGQISGDQSDETTLHEQSRINDIVVMTPMILVNALRESDPQIKLSDALLLVLDECHHTEKDHPYMKVMDIYLKQKLCCKDGAVKAALPRVLGMTATLGAGSVSTPRDAESHVLTLCANLDALEVIKVTENCDELYKYVSHPHTEMKPVAKRLIGDPFHCKIVEIMIKIQRKSSCRLELPFEYGSLKYETAINQRRVALEEEGDHEGLVFVRNLIVYNRCLQIYQDMRKEEALEFLRRTFYNETVKAESDSKLGRLINNEAEVNVDQFLELQQVRSSDNPKLIELKRLLLEEFKKSDKARGIVFMKTREFTSAVVKWINEDPELSKIIINPKRLVGGGSERRDQMTKAEQLEAICSFDLGNCNLLVSTTIGEEGLDIPECSFVIRYETVTSEIAEVQARGRVRVHLPSSHFVEIVTRGSQNELQAKANKYRQTLMDDASQALKRLVESDQHNEIQKRQLDRLKKLDEKERHLRFRRQTSKASDVKVHCKLCGTFACKASDITRINTFYVVTDSVLDTKIKIKESPKPIYDSVGKIYCKKCTADWGVLAQFGNGVKLPSLKCASFKFTLSGKAKLVKKWKSVPFEILEKSEGDLLADCSDS